VTGCVGEKSHGGEDLNGPAGAKAGLRGALAGPAWEAEAQGGLLRWLLLLLHF